MVPRHDLKQRLKNALYFALGANGLAARRAAGWAGATADEAPLRILMYHKVSRQPHNPPSVPPWLLREHMEVLRRRASPIALDDLLDARAGRRPLPPRAVLVTFDDGYRDNLEAAAILHTLGIPALMFLPTRFIGAHEPLPHDRALFQTGIDNPTLDWDEVRALCDRGFTIGSHGESHRMFSTLPPDEALGEMRRSKARIEERIGRPVRAFAYVKGGPDSFTPETVRLCEQAGYEVAFTTISGPGSSGHPRFLLPRYNVEPVSAFTFARLLDGDCDLVGLKDTALGVAGKRVLNRILGSDVP